MPELIDQASRPRARHTWHQQYETDRPSNDQIIDAVCLTMEPAGLDSAQVARIAAASVPLAKALMRAYVALGCSTEEALYNALDTMASYMPWRSSDAEAAPSLDGYPKGAPEYAAVRATYQAESVDEYVSRVRTAYMPLASRPRS